MRFDIGIAATSRATAIHEVNERMGEVRQKFITNIAGQDMIYGTKEKEAERFLTADPDPTTETGWEQIYPFIAGEVGVTAPTAFEVAQIYANMAAQWKTLGSQLESLRVETSTAIQNSTSETEIEAILNQFRTTLEMF